MNSPTLRAFLLAAGVGVAAGALPAAAQQDAEGAPQPAAPSAAEPTEPCAAPEFRQFDFWIGEWEVRNAAGELVGTNRITRILSGCALEEDWESRRGSRGRSLNAYDSRRRQWHQTWVDEMGQVLELDGGLEEGAMVLAGEVPAAEAGASPSLHRISWEPREGGKVRQHWQTSRDGGDTWTTVFDGLYSKR